MRRIRLALTAALLAGATLPLHAQAPALGGCDPDGPTPSFLSAANEIHYGCGWLFRSKPPQYAQAIQRFQTALTREPDNAVALYLLGAAWAGYGQPDSARVALRRALALDPSVVTTLAPRVAEVRLLGAKMDEALGNAPAANGAQAAHAPARGDVAPAPATPPAPARPAPAFQPGDSVDVRVAGSDWQPGTVARVEDERGDGSRYLYMVRHRVVLKDPSRMSVTRTYPQDIRPRTATPAPAPAPAPGGPLVTGAYACEHVTFSPARGRQSTPKGVLTLRADGTYRLYDNGGTGRYRYDVRSGAITWLGGPVADMQPERTTFTRGRATAEILLRLQGVYEWSCGIGLR